jgi:hypothetical protein
VSVSANGELVTYPSILLRVANELISNGQATVSVVVSHMACEVAAERALSAAFKARGVASLEDAVTGFMNGFNLANDRNRKLYVALTGDAIESQGFWAAFRESAARRSKIVHGGQIASVAEAHASLQAATSLVAHLKQ